MGPTPMRTPTPTLGMRLSCRPNFVNVYTIAYRVQYARVHARIPNGHPREILARKIAPRVGQVGEDPRACPAREGSSRGSRRGCPCRCRRHGMPALLPLFSSTLTYLSWLLNMNLANVRLYITFQNISITLSKQFCVSVCCL